MTSSISRLIEGAWLHVKVTAKEMLVRRRNSMRSSSKMERKNGNNHISKFINNLKFHIHMDDEYQSNLGVAFVQA